MLIPGRRGTRPRRSRRSSGRRSPFDLPVAEAADFRFRPRSGICFQKLDFVVRLLQQINQSLILFRDDLRVIKRKLYIVA